MYWIHMYYVYSMYFTPCSMHTEWRPYAWILPIFSRICGLGHGSELPTEVAVFGGCPAALEDLAKLSGCPFCCWETTAAQG